VFNEQFVENQTFIAAELLPCSS